MLAAHAQSGAEMEGQEPAAMEGAGEDMMRQMMGEFGKMGEKEVRENGTAYATSWRVDWSSHPATSGLHRYAPTWKETSCALLIAFSAWLYYASVCFVRMQDYNGVMDNIMQQLLSRELMYDPIKQVN